MKDQEYSDFLVQDLAKELLHSVAIYAVALIGYWTLVA